MASDTLKSIDKIDNKQKQKPKKPGFFQKTPRFFKDVIAELKRCSWPTKAELKASTIAVIIFVLVMSAFTGGLDFIFANIMKLIIK